MITIQRFVAPVALGLGVLLSALSADAATSFVQDGAALFSPDTVTQLNTKIGAFNAQTGKAIVVVTVPSLGTDTLQSGAQKIFSEQNINGVLIFISKSDRKDIIVPGRATSAFFPAETTQSIRQSMESQFKLGDFDGGITAAVNGTLDVFRAHMNGSNNVPSRGNAYPIATHRTYVQHRSGGLSMFWWIIIIVFGFFILRSIMRAASGPRYMGGPQAGPGGMPMGGPGYGGPGYGGYGGGGGFWSGLLGGLGGAWLGNEMFRNNNSGGGDIVNQSGGGVAGDQGGGWGAGDAAGWG
ncbi:MAG: TPM domain-containing protein, partial [Candidatus Eremiobacteraeota bacterium]|nr:TPM domain-containing protein [Candidatus Eremiobacteraeota bacterium]